MPTLPCHKETPSQSGSKPDFRRAFYGLENHTFGGEWTYAGEQSSDFEAHDASCAAVNVCTPRVSLQLSWLRPQARGFIGGKNKIKESSL